MKFRRRYQVVVEGVSGQAAAQRTVISEHRSEAEAREAARLERARLEVIHGGGARSWRILVMHEHEVVGEERPEAEGEDLLRADPAPSDGPADSADEAPAAGPAKREEPLGRDEPAENGEPSPEGPVPDWVIQRFEESIARRGEREEAGPAQEGDPLS